MIFLQNSMFKRKIFLETEEETQSPNNIRPDLRRLSAVQPTIEENVEENPTRHANRRMSAENRRREASPTTNGDDDDANFPGSAYNKRRKSSSADSSATCDKADFGESKKMSLTIHLQIL